MTLLVSDFQSEYRIDLTPGLGCISWARFEALTQGLMGSDTRIGRFFAPKKAEQPKRPRSY